jgi:hypothetical protein
MTPPAFGTFVPDLAAFAFGLGCAWLLGWHTTDLVWSLWLGSLVVGYLSILSMLGKGLYIGSALVFSEGFPAEYRIRAVVIGASLALFVLAFFSVHFCGFHAIHAGLLQSLLPLRDLPRLHFGFLNPFGVWSLALHDVMPRYGAFLIPVVVAERRVLFGPIAAVVNARRAGQPDLGIGQLLGASGVRAHDALGGPYLNVMRMHFLIIFLGICHAFDLDSFPAFALAYAFYFFPWSVLAAPQQAQGGDLAHDAAPEQQHAHDEDGAHDHRHP